MSNSVSTTSLLKEAITATPAALAYIQNCQLKKNTFSSDTTVIRFGITKYGCSGYGYIFDFTDTPAEDDYIFKIAETILIVVDKKSYPYLKGTCLDYQVNSFGSMIKFLNPNETASCGCGESFSIEP